jgi:hypothetical protein
VVASSEYRSARPSLLKSVALVSVLLLAALVAACQGCRTGNPVSPTAPEEPPTVRLYVVSDIAGALEPCGCVKDQLGGLDHAAALIRSEGKKAKATAVLSAGPLFFLDPVVEGEKRAQDVAKAETMATALRELGLVAFAPGRNDFAAGQETLADLAARSGAAMLAANVHGASASLPIAKTATKELGGVRFGFIGVANPNGMAQAPPVEGLEASAPIEAVRGAVEALRADGAQVFVLLAAVGRGEAKRIADAVPDLTAIVVGSTGSLGEGNTPPPPPERIGNVVIAETANHLQTVSILDLHVRDGAYTFADASNLDQTQKREDLTRRINEMRVRVAVWEQDGKVSPADIAARRSDMAKWEAERAALEKQPAPATGSFFRYAVREVRATLGKDETLSGILEAYYKRVNDENRRAFADRKPKPVAAGEASYVGVDACTSCHAPARAFWEKTPHAHAYATLADQHKEFNLDCVSCHVTGYERPGGSTVTHVKGLESVQCEVCHGPGSNHAKSGDPKKILAKPETSLCTSCHHPPHVHEFDPAKKWAEIIGPGHGRPL